MTYRILTACVAVLPVLVSAAAQPAFGWFDMTHLVIAEAAGYAKWYNAAGADIAKIKAGKRESYNHYFNNIAETGVTPDIVRRQVPRYDSPDDAEGHLYGAIIGSLRAYRESREKDKYAEYHVALCAHYIGDLSQPFHNIPYDRFNRMYHKISEEFAEDDVREHIETIRARMRPLTIKSEAFEDSLAEHIARMANSARQLGGRLRAENRLMSREEIYGQLAESASLLRAVLDRIGREERAHIGNAR